jgi:glucosamine--fructose-6-phosphate aminotransferase (isomerizing)
VTLRQELGEQAEAIERLVAANRHVMGDVAALVDDSVGHAVMAARGTSDNAARYAQYVWGARNAMTVGLATPSLFGAYASPPSLAGSLVAGISQSGQSPDLVAVVAEGRRQGRPTLAVTNDPTSPLAKAADQVVDLAAGPERAVAATKTYTAELAAVALCSLAMAGDDPAALDPLPGAIAEVLAAEQQIAAAVGPLVDADRCVVVGRGYHYATVHEWALKLQELTYILAQPYSAADFQHGPTAVVDEGFPVLVVASSGPLFDPVAELAAGLRDRGAVVIAICDRSDGPADELVRIPSVDEWLAPIVAAPALQLFSYHLTIARGADPEAPRGLTKVTRTR